VLTALIGPSSRRPERRANVRRLAASSSVPAPPRPAPPRPAPRLRARGRPSGRAGRACQPAPRLADTPHASPQDCSVSARPAPRRASGLGGVQVDAAAVEQAQLHRASLRPFGGQSGQPPLYPAAPPARRPLATCPKARPAPRLASGLEGVEVDAAAVEHVQRAARAQYSQRA
jgi:hypothetical protein